MSQKITNQRFMIFLRMKAPAWGDDDWIEIYEVECMTEGYAIGIAVSHACRTMRQVLEDSGVSTTVSAKCAHATPCAADGTLERQIPPEILTKATRAMDRITMLDALAPIDDDGPKHWSDIPPLSEDPYEDPWADDDIFYGGNAAQNANQLGNAWGWPRKSVTWKGHKLPSKFFKELCANWKEVTE